MINLTDGSEEGWKSQAHDKRRQYPHAAHQVPKYKYKILNTNTRDIAAHAAISGSC